MTDNSTAPDIRRSNTLEPVEQAIAPTNQPLNSAASPIFEDQLSTLTSDALKLKV